MSVELNNDFFPDLRNIAMEMPLQIIPNNAKVVVNTPCNIRFRKNSSPEREKNLCTLDFIDWFTSSFLESANLP